MPLDGGMGGYEPRLACKRDADAVRSKGTRGVRDRHKRDVPGKRRRLVGGAFNSFEFAVDGDVDVLIETGIGLHARFGCSTAFDYAVVMAEETNTPFEGSKGVVVLQSMSHLLGCFDEFAVRHTGGRPCFWEMIGVELMEFASPARSTADDDVFVITLPLLMGIHEAIVHVDAERELQIADSATMGGGYFGVRKIARNDATQTVFYYGFQVP